MNVRSTLSRATSRPALAGLLLCSVLATAVYAADARLDLAIDNIVKAIALIEAAENRGVDPPFNGYDELAVSKLKQAQRLVEQAKAYADSTATR